MAVGAGWQKWKLVAVSGPRDFIKGCALGKLRSVAKLLK